MARPSDGQVEGYERVVNGKVIRVNAYAKKATSTTSAAVAARRRPGRPRIAAQPGSYASGRDIPGVRPRVMPEETPAQHSERPE